MTSRGADDAHRLADGAARRFGNDRRGHKALIKWLAQTPQYRVVFEPTGSTIAPSTARSASLAFRSSRSIRVRRAASLRRPATWRRPIGSAPLLNDIAP